MLPREVMKYCRSAILGIMWTTAPVMTQLTTSLADRTVHSSCCQGEWKLL